MAPTRAIDVAINMQQVFGGHGYIREWGMEQFVRDSRIAMIYEGTNGIQAMDLCGRKLAANGGRAIQAFFKLVDDEIAAGKDDAAARADRRAARKSRGRAEGGDHVVHAERDGRTPTIWARARITICISWGSWRSG